MTTTSDVSHGDLLSRFFKFKFKFKYNKRSARDVAAAMARAATSARSVTAAAAARAATAWSVTDVELGGSVTRL